MAAVAAHEIKGVERPAGPVERVLRGDEEPTPLRWTRAEYYRLGALGILDAHPHVQLIEGEIVEMSPQLTPHATAIDKVADVLGRVFGAGYYARQQKPLFVGEGSEPEPDVVIVPGEPDDYALEHPRSAPIVVEVSDKTLRYDRTRKASLYAKAGIPDYWVLDLVHWKLEVRREPVRMPNEPFGFGYDLVTVQEPGDTVTCLAAPDQPIPVTGLLPRVRPAATESQPKPKRSTRSSPRKGQL